MNPEKRIPDQNRDIPAPITQNTTNAIKPNETSIQRQNLNQENQPAPEQYVQLDMFKEKSIPLAEKNDDIVKTPDQNLTPELQAYIAEQDKVIRRLESKITKLEEALKALQNGDKSKTTLEELRTLETKLPGFTKMIKERMKALSSEIAGTDIKALQEKLRNKMESMQKLLTASENMNKQLRPDEINPSNESDGNTEQKDFEAVVEDEKPYQENAAIEIKKSETKIANSERSLETLSNFKEITDALLGSLSELNELLEKHGSVSESEKNQIEIEIKAVVGKINEILEQLKTQEEEVNNDKILRGEEIQTRILELQNDKESQEEENDSEIETLKKEYIALQKEADNNISQIRSLFSPIQQKLNSGFNLSSLNEKLKQETEMSLISSGTTVSEKFQKIEQGSRLNNLQV